MSRRVGFLKMLDDCEAGKIDLIITKSVSRFARNTQDCLEVIRRLKALTPPVGVLFETENLNTAESKSEFTLGVMSLVAQGESEQKSTAVTWSIIERFKKGIPIISTHNLLGFDKNNFGQVFIVEEEANVVRFIYESYLDGLNACEIARSLTESRIPTVMGNCIWKGSSILRILRNEKYCGDVLMQKTFTSDCFSHKKVKNVGQRPRYLLKNGIPAIISRNKWEAVQELLDKRHFSRNNVLKPEMGVFINRVKSGALRGFIYINPRWRNKEILAVIKKIKNEEEKVINAEYEV